MKNLLKLLAALALGATAIMPSLHAAEPRPNIIFLFADDLAANAVGYSGNKDVITPHIDKLAQDGVRFTSHYNTTAICMASRVSVLTGLYEYRHGCNFDHGNLERRFMEKSYTVMLQKAGYCTGFAGKLGFDMQGEKFEVFAPMFDQWAGGPGQTPYATAKNEGIAKYAGDFLPLFNFWGAVSAQSMAIVTPEWKYIHWYYGKAMTPAEELFHLGKDPFEMTNSAADPSHADTLAAMRKNYDSELAAIATNLAPGHGYENYPILFSRTIPWEQKASLGKGNKVKGGESESNDEPEKKRKTKP